MEPGGSPPCSPNPTARLIPEPDEPSLSLTSIFFFEIHYTVEAAYYGHFGSRTF
jgi:hypothetical protein